MQESQALQQEQAVLQQSPGEILEWLNRVWSAQHAVTADFNWLGLAETAGTRANLHGDVQWAEVAIRVYTWLANQTSNKMKRNSVLDSAMNLRASMIVRHGTEPGHSVLDNKIIEHWFYEHLDWPYEEVTRKTGIWKELPLEEIQALHRIKTRLRVLKLLVERERLQPDEQLKTWLAFYPRLP